MNFSENIFEISNKFMDRAKHVTINSSNIYKLSDTIKEKEKWPEIDMIDGNIILIELVAASINYCYFYGRHDIRPNNSSSTSMYNTLLNSFYKYDFSSSKIEFSNAIDEFKRNLSLNRFPLLEERCKHLDELKNEGINFANDVYNTTKDYREINPLLTNMIGLFPGFASDIFLKRASLFFIQLYRRFGWFEKDLHNFFVPADYQIPKMLKHYELISYSPELQYMINNNILIQRHSIEECEIRSATILVIKVLCKLTGWNVADIDSWFFLKRNECKNPFHLTITTDY